MKTIFSLLFTLIAVIGLNAQCVTGFSQEFNENLGTFQAYYSNGQDTSANDVVYEWVIDFETTLSGEVITYTFEEDMLHSVCLTATTNECTATYCDSIYVSSSENNDSTIVDEFYANAYYYFESEEDCTATVYAEPIGGTAPYSYLWSNDASTNTINNACGNDFYCVTITDAEGLVAEACVLINYYNYQDSTWIVNDTLETVIDTCLDEIVLAEIVDYVIEDGYVIVTWGFIDENDVITTITITYPVEDSIAMGAYEIYLYVNCGNLKSVTAYSDLIVFTENDFLAIATIQKDIEYSLYPNPVSDVLNIELNIEKNDNTNLIILNTAGQVVYSENIGLNSGLNTLRLNVNNLVEGMYFIRITGNEKYSTMRFIK